MSSDGPLCLKCRSSDDSCSHLTPQITNRVSVRCVNLPHGHFRSSHQGLSSCSAEAMRPRLHFVVDPMGWLCVGLVCGVWSYNTFFIPQLVLLPHYQEGHIPWAMVACECPPPPPSTGGTTASLHPCDESFPCSPQVITWPRRSAWRPCSERPRQIPAVWRRTPTSLTQVRSPPASSSAAPRVTCGAAHETALSLPSCCRARALGAVQ